MCKLVCYVYVLCVMLVGYGLARDYSRESSENVQFTSAKRLRRHDHNYQSPENHHTNNHRQTETRRHEQQSSGNDFKHYSEHQQNQNYLDHSHSGDQFRPATAIARQNNDLNIHERYSNEFNHQPTQNHVSFNKHKVFNQNQQEIHERPPPGHETDFNRHDLQNLPPARHDHDRQTGQYISDNQHHDQRGKGSDMLEQPRGLHGQQFEDNPVDHHFQAGHPENQHNTQHRNQTSDRYNQDMQTGRYHSDNQHHDHRGEDSVILEKPRGVHSQQFEDNPVDHNHRTGHSENQHETQHRNQWNDRGGVQQHSFDHSQQFNATQSNYFNLKNTLRQGVQMEKDITNEEVVTERSSKEQLAQEENLQLSGTSTRDQNSTSSHKIKTSSQLETSHQYAITTLAPTTTPTTIATTHKSNTTHPHPHLTSVVVLTAPDIACADGMAKDFTNKCRPVYKTDNA